MYKLMTIIILSSLMLFACSTVDISKDIRGTEWEVSSIGSSTLVKADLMNGLPTMLFGNEGALSGSTSCNKFNGSFNVDGPKISLQPGAMTKMFCPGNTEQDFLNAMGRIKNLKFDHEKLLLLDGSDVLMTLVPKE